MDQHLIIEEEKKDRGFTLVELLIVIVILGILATVTVFAVRGITDRGQTNACQTEKRTFETAIEAWYAQNGQLTNPTEQNLVDADLIRGLSDKVDVDNSANPSTVVVPNPTTSNACTAAQLA